MLQTLPLPLPRGVSTGFGVPDENKIPFDTFKAACEHAATVMSGKVREIYEAYSGDIVTSYHEATVVYDFGRRSVRVLCSAGYPVLVFADAGMSRSTRHLTFVDCPALVPALGEKLNCAMMAAAYANERPAPPFTDRLDDQEKRDIELWKPARIGDLVFKR